MNKVIRFLKGNYGIATFFVLLVFAVIFFAVSFLLFSATARSYDLSVYDQGYNLDSYPFEQIGVFAYLLGCVFIAIILGICQLRISESSLVGGEFFSLLINPYIVGLCVCSLPVIADVLGNESIGKNIQYYIAMLAVGILDLFLLFKLEKYSYVNRSDEAVRLVRSCYLLVNAFVLILVFIISFAMNGVDDVPLIVKHFVEALSFASVVTTCSSAIVNAVDRWIFTSDSHETEGRS